MKRNRFWKIFKERDQDYSYWIVESVQDEKYILYHPWIWSVRPVAVFLDTDFSGMQQKYQTL